MVVQVVEDAMDIRAEMSHDRPDLVVQIVQEDIDIRAEMIRDGPHRPGEVPVSYGKNTVENHRILEE